MRAMVLGLLIVAVGLTPMSCTMGTSNLGAKPGALPATPQKVAAPSRDAAGAPDMLAEYAKGVRVKRLENGLVIITKENHAAQVVSVYAAVHAGSLFEQEYLGCGISHLTEHLVAGGSTTHRKEAEIAKTLEQIGAESNAFTSDDRTVYYIDTVPAHVNTAVDLLADNIMSAAISPEEFDREFGVVQREILNGASDPGRQAFYLLDATMFPYLPQGLRTIGYYKDIQRLTRDDVVTYYKRMYVPSNAVVCAAGDFDGAVVLAKLEAAFGKWDGPHAPAVAVPEASPLVSDQVVVQELGTKLEPATVLIGYPSCQLGNPDLYAMDVLAGILGAGDSSRLGADLKVKRNLVYGITSYNQTPSWPGGIFGVHFTCDPDKVDEVRQAVAAHLAEFCRAAPSKEEVEKVKKQTIAELVMGNRTAAAQARTLSGDQLQIDDPFFSIKYVQNIQAVEPQDILRVARQYLQNAHSVTAIVRPKAAPAQAAGPQAEAGLKTTTTRVTFQDSGLTLLVYRTPGQPAVSMIATMKAGQTFETAENAGISAMAAEYLTRGTSRMDEGQIAGFFDAIGGSIAARSGWNSIYVESTVLKEDFAKAVKVFADVVAHPAFAPPLLQSTQARQLAALRAAQGNPVGECSMHFDEQFFTGSPYRFPMMGTEETIQKQTAEAVRDFYKAHAVGRNMVVAIAGDIDAGAAEQLVRAEFAGLPAGVAWQPPTGLPARTIENQEIYIYKTDKPSCVVMVGYPGLDLSNLRDRYPMDVFDTIISGYSTPRGLLHEVLRGQSLVYMVQFGGRPGLLPGYFKSIALCQSEKATLVARLLEDLVWSSRDKTFSAEELSNAKSIILTARQMDRQTPESVALEMALDELYGLGYDFEEKFAKGIGSVTADDVKRASSAIINKPIIVIATPKPELVDRAELQRAFDAKKLEDMKAKTPEHVPAAQPKHLDTK